MNNIFSFFRAPTLCFGLAVRSVLALPALPRHSGGAKWSIFIGILISILPSKIFAQQKTALGEKYMVVSAREEASQAGAYILEKGGNAFDAAVAVHFALAVVYPQAGNIGGGGFAVIRTKDGINNAINFREMAPGKATKDMFLDKEGNVIPKLSEVGALAAGVPGSVDGLWQIHQKYGKLTWAECLQPAISLANKGFILTELDAYELNKEKDLIEKTNPKNKFFQKKGNFVRGDKILQEDLGVILKFIQQDGKDGFYKGATAQLIVEEMNRSKGIISYQDLENYHSEWVTPITMNFYGYEIVTMPPPSSGGIALLQMCYMLEKLQIHNYPYLSKEFISLVVEVERLAYADRSEHLGDPNFYTVPTKKLLNKRYLNQRMKKIKPLKYISSSKVKPGKINKQESEQTTHFSIVDEEGNAISLTTTINSKYGSRLFVTGAGFLLNNEMDDFSTKPGVPNQFGLIGNKANEIQPYKRMLSSMTPTIVTKNDKVILITGTPGGATIITSVLQNILQILVYKMRLDEALKETRFHHQWLPDVIFVEDSTSKNKQNFEDLKNYSYTIKYREPIGRVDAIQWLEGKWLGGADPRGDDNAIGK